MKTAPLLLVFQLTVRLPEIIICLLGAIVLGFTLHFFWNARKSMRLDQPKEEEGISENDNWKLKYYNDMDMQEKALEQLREKLAESRENEQILSIELEEAQERLKSQPASQSADTSGDPSLDYLSQLRSAQENLLQHNQHINRLLEQIQQLKEAEKKSIDLHLANEQLQHEVNTLQKKLSEKEAEVHQIRQQQRLTEEIKDRMEKAYGEFGQLQHKLQKLEAHLAQPHSRSIDYDELHDSYFKLTRDFDDLRTRQASLWDENQRLSRILSDTEDKLREANFHRQQLQKKAGFLEELNKDLQEVNEHNKKLESQLKRISEMEALLSKAMPEHRDIQNEGGSM